MQIGLVGLGRMGAGIAGRLRQHGHDVLGHDPVSAARDVDSLVALVQGLSAPRALWVMVPAGDATESVVTELSRLLSPGDLVIDGGNSFYRDSIRRADDLRRSGLRFLDAGTSGGIGGREHGYCLMIGGERESFTASEPIFAALATPGGYAYLGPAGAGHYAKMVHNGIEYGLLQAYAEGFHLLDAAPYDYDARAVAALWNQGSVVRSWLLELAERAFARDPALESLRGFVEDSGEGRWTVLEAVERGVPAGVLAQALFARFASRDDNSYAMRVIAALRREFGGHAVRGE